VAATLIADFFIFKIMKDYRKNYIRTLQKTAYKMPLDLSKFEIHHIDLDRKNNDVFNLVLIETSVHRQYHERRYYRHQTISNIPDAKKGIKQKVKFINKELLKKREEIDYTNIHAAEGIINYLEGGIIELSSFYDIEKLVKKEAKKQHSYILKSRKYEK